jgi:aminoglycoside 6-adenylyltransferase
VKEESIPKAVGGDNLSLTGLVPVARDYDDMTTRFVAWARNDPDIRGAILLGSRARSDHPADDWSDLDILFIVTEPVRFLSSGAWLENLGAPLLTFLEKTGTGQATERRALFEGGLDVDFVPTSLQDVRRMVREGLPSELAKVIRRGARAVLDKDGQVATLMAALLVGEESRPPTEQEFLAVVHDLLYHAIWTAKKIKRGELWTAKTCVDNHMKWRLLRIMEWHSRAFHGWEYDTWHDGRFIEQWGDPRALEGLRRAFAGYDEGGIWSALFATLELFRWLAVETAGQLSFTYPRFADERVTQMLKAYYGSN